MSDAVPLDIARCLGASGTRARLGSLASVLVYRDVVGSTNDVALELVNADAVDGTTVVASRQTAGRGRHGRTWFSPLGGLYVSVVLHQTTSPTVTLMAGVAAAEGVRTATGVEVELEWPNDLVTTGGAGDAPIPRRQKLGGILCETGPHDTVVVGIGLNLSPAEYPSDIADRASSVDRYAVDPATRGQVLVEVLASFALWRQRVRAEGPRTMLARWRELSPTCDGAPVAWDASDGRRVGLTAGLDADGALRVRRDDRIERITAGRLDWYPEDSTGATG